MRHGEDDSIEIVQFTHRDEAETMLVSRLMRVGERIVDARLDSVFTERSHDIGHPPIAQIRYVLLEGKTENSHSRTFDSALGGDQHLDEALRHKSAHPVVDPPPGQ